MITARIDQQLIDKALEQGRSYIQAPMHEDEKSPCKTMAYTQWPSNHTIADLATEISQYLAALFDNSRDKFEVLFLEEDQSPGDLGDGDKFSVLLYWPVVDDECVF
jgi:hypothetical protein